METDRAALQEIIDLSTEINRTKDVDLLLDKILTKARASPRADGGSIYLKEDDKLSFKCVQNDTLQKRLGPGRKLSHMLADTVPLNSSSIVGSAAAHQPALNIADRSSPAARFQLCLQP